GQAGNAGEAARARMMLLVLRDSPELVKAVLPLAQNQLRTGARLREATRLFLGVLAARTQQLDAAEEIYRSCLPRPNERPRDNEAEVYGGLLRVLWQGRKYQAIEEVCRHGLDHAQGTKRVVFHVDRARALMALGKPDEALAEAKSAVELAAAEDKLYCRSLR